MSAQQQRIWSLRQQGELPAQSVVLLEGELDADVLRRALAATVERHEILRTTFRPLAGQRFPFQVVHEHLPPAYREVDARGLFAAVGPDAVEGLAREERDALRGGAEAEATPLRAVLAALHTERHVLVLTLPALCADFRTLSVVAGDLVDAYRAGLEPRAGEAEVMQYADFAEWQHEWWSGEQAREGLEYWRERDLSDLDGWRWPWERPAAEPAGALRSVGVDIDGETLARIAAVTTRRKISPAAFFLTCWSTLVSRCVDRPEPVLGVSFDGRGYEELETLAGPLARLLPVACRVGLDQPLTQALREVETACEEVAFWQEHFHWDAVSVPEAGEDAAFFHAAFEYHEVPVWEPVSGLRFSIDRQFAAVDRFAIQLSCLRRRDALSARFSYPAGLFDTGAVDRLADGFAALTRSAVENPCRRLADLEILSPAERRRVLFDFNRGASGRLRPACIHWLIAEQAERSPSATALSDPRERLSYRDLSRRAKGLAGRLRKEGIGPEDRVGVLLERSAELAVALLGILEAGGAYVALEPGYPKARSEHILRDAGARFLLTRTRWPQGLPEWGGRVLCVDEAPDPAAGETRDPVAMLPTNLAYIAYTSGSTGLPKGVLCPHQGVVSYLDFLVGAYALASSDVVLQLAAPSFDASVREIFGTLAVGGRLVIPDVRELEDPHALLATIRREKVSAVLSLVPTTLRWLTAAARRDAAGCPSLRLALVSGEVLHFADPLEARESFLENARVVNQYGPTECTMTSSYHPLPRGAASPEAAGAVAIGRPIANARIHVTDRRLRVVPPGVTGELLIGGAGLTRGYQGHSGMTAQKFVPDPFAAAPGKRLCRTGDLASYRAGGELDFLGRIDAQVKLRGQRVEPGEIESVVCEHPGVDQAAVIVRGGMPAEQHLVAYGVRRDAAVDARALRRFLRRKLPDYMVPSEFVWLERLPRTTSGKVDRRALAALAPQATAERPFVAPRNPMEEVLACIWSEVLEVPRVGADDDFFELGGHSLLAARLAGRVAESLQTELSVRDVFEVPTLAAMAKLVAASRGSATARISPLEPKARPEEVPLSFAQQRQWFMARLEPDSPVFNSLRAVRLEGRLRVSVMGRALAEVVRRHESLRTSFPDLEGRPVQVVEAAFEPSLPVVDLAGLERKSQQAELEKLAQEEAQRVFQIARAPLLRVLLLRLGEGEHVGFLTLHHIISDAWSVGVLIQELGALYQAYLEGAPSPLPELEIQYADFSIWQRRWLSGEVLEKQLAYWRRRLAGAPAALDLPTDRPRGGRRTFRGERRPFRLTPELTAAIKELSRRQGATVFMVLLAAYVALLHRYTGEEDIVVGAPVAGRDRPELEGLIGYFLNALALRCDLAGDPSFEELLARVREVVLEAYAHQEIPFEKLVEELRPRRLAGRPPYFQVVLNLYNGPEPEIELPELSLHPFDVPVESSKYELTLYVGEYAERLAGALAYDTDLFEPSRMDRFLEHFETLLAKVVEHPDLRLRQLVRSIDGRRAKLRAKTIRKTGARQAVELPKNTVAGLELAQNEGS